MDKIPIIDISSLREIPLTEKIITDLAHQFKDAMYTCGFVYMIAHGIDNKLIAESFTASERFFNEDVEYAKQLSIRGKGDNFRLGYVDSTNEIFRGVKQNRTSKMAWDYTLDSDELRMMPQNQQDLLGKLWDECNILNDLLMPVIANIIDFRIEDFRKLHKHIGDQNLKTSSMRLLYYPEYNAESVEKSYHRLSPHSDYGTYTFLFQDEIGGLQVYK